MKTTATSDLKIIKEYILLPFLFSLLDKDMKTLYSAHLKIKQPYIDLIQEAIDQVTKDFAHIKSEMRVRDIHLYDEVKKKDGVYCKYKIKGYHGDFNMLWEYVRGQIECRLNSYLHNSSPVDR